MGKIIRRLVAASVILIMAAGGTAAAASAAAATKPQLAGLAGKSMTGTWEGTYTCGQGLTGLDLKISRSGHGTGLAATFSFYPVPSNASVPTGVFTMSGSIRPGSRVVLRYRHWVIQPPGWIMVSLSGSVSGDRFHGRVIGGPGSAPGCTRFSVTKLKGQYNRSRVTGTWKGSYSGCAQGPTGMTLTIKPAKTAGRRIKAVFSFYALPSNPSVPSGSYAMTGYYFPGGIALYQVKWIVQPAGYGMVNLVGGPPHGRQLAGAIVGCSTFSVKRAR
jgi:hypothetical protein